MIIIKKKLYARIISERLCALPYHRFITEYHFDLYYLTDLNEQECMYRGNLKCFPHTCHVLLLILSC